MDANKFYDKCDSLMCGLQDADMFGDALDTGLAPVGYTVVTAEVNNLAKIEFDLGQYILDYFNETIAPIEEDFCRYVYGIVGYIGSYSTKSELICKEYNALFPYDATDDYQYAIYRYAFIHYGVKMEFDNFKDIYNEDVAFIKLFNFRFRYATMQDIVALKGHRDVNIDVINRFAMNPLFTQMLCDLDTINETELTIHSTNSKQMCEYLIANLPVSETTSFIRFLLAHKDCNELLQYVGKVPNNVFVQYNGKCLLTVLKCHIMYGNNAEFFRYYLVKYSCYDNLIKARLNDAKFMNACYKNLTELDWWVFSSTLSYNVQITRDEFDSIKTRMVPALLENKASYSDMVYYLIAAKSDSKLGEYARGLEDMPQAQQLVYEFIIKFFENKLNRTNESVYPKRYHLRFKNARFTFSFSEMIAYPNEILNVMQSYVRFSNYVVGRREQGDMQLIFGEQSSLQKLQDRSYIYKYSVEKFVDDKPSGNFTIDEIKRYNALVHVVTNTRDKLIAMDDKTFYYYDNVLDFINRNVIPSDEKNNKKKWMLTNALLCQNSRLCVSCLKAALCYDTERKRALCFIIKLLTSIRPNSVTLSSSTDVALSGVKLNLGDAGLCELVGSFDALLGTINKSKFKSALVNSGKGIIIVLKI